MTNEYNDKELEELKKFMSENDNDNDDFDINYEEKEAQRILEQTRKRKLEILEKYKSNDINKSSSNSNNNTNSNNSNKIINNNINDEDNIINQEINNNTNKTIFNMFSNSPTDFIISKDIVVKKGKVATREALLEGENPHLQGNWDDNEGYYKTRIGEIIADRYQTLGIVGKGVFSTVLKCIDISKSKPIDNNNNSSDKTNHQIIVAIKMIRNNDTMRKAAEKEHLILKLLSDRDPDNKKHCVKLIDSFDYRNHIAFIFEYEQMNLREALKKFGKDVGINIAAVRLYAKQLFIALKLLHDLRIVHADIKLDNILCSGDWRQVKLCDFGSAFRLDDTDNDPTPYLVSRFYRAPEIILGLQYDSAIDLWSVCVCLYELFTGHVMFPGRTNNDMLRLTMAMKGKFPNKLLKLHLRSYESLKLDPHFDNDLKFRQQEIDPVSGHVILRLVEIIQPTKDLTSLLRGHKAGADDARLVGALADLLEKGLNLDPSKRLSVSEALKHPFSVMKI